MRLVVLDPLHCVIQPLGRPGDSGIFFDFKRHLDRLHDTLPSEDHRQAETATELGLEMADGPDIPPVEEDRSTDARYYRADPEWCGPFGVEDALCSLFTLFCKFVMFEAVGREHRVEGNAVDGCGRPCDNLGIAVHAEHGELY